MAPCRFGRQVFGTELSLGSALDGQPVEDAKKCQTTGGVMPMVLGDSSTGRSNSDYHTTGDPIHHVGVPEV